MQKCVSIFKLDDKFALADTFFLRQRKLDIDEKFMLILVFQTQLEKVEDTKKKFD